MAAAGGLQAADAPASAPTGSQTVIPGVEVYQITKNGLALQATLQGTKYWKDRDLNFAAAELLAPGESRFGPRTYTNLPGEMSAGVIVRLAATSSVAPGCQAPSQRFFVSRLSSQETTAACSAMRWSL